DGGVRQVAVTLAPASVELPGIVVTASRGAEQQRESPASIAVLGGREVTRRNVTTLDQALPFVQGLTVNNDDIAIRGSTGIANGVGSRVLLLLDGHPVLTGDGGEMDFESLPLLDLDRVEVVKGAYSALYGSNALGGVVNLITSPIGAEPQTVVRAHLGMYQVPSRYRFTNDELTEAGLELQHSRRIGGVGVRLFAGREHNDGYTDNNASGRWLVRLKAASSPEASHPWDGYAIYAHEVDGSFFTWLDAAHPFQVDTGSRGDTEISNKFLTGGSWSPVVRARTVVKLSPYFNYNTLRNDFRANNDFHNATRLGSTASVVFTPGPRAALTFGVDGAYTHVHSNFLGNRDLDDGALFTQVEARLAEPLKLVAGARLDLHHATGGERETLFSPKLGLVATPSEHVSLRASLGRGYRAPSAIEQFVNTFQFGFQVVPNPNLKGERAWAGEAGITASRGRFWVDASLFESQYRGLISPAPAPGQPLAFEFQNVDRARVRGFDGGVRIRVAKNILDLSGNYLFLDTRDLKRGEPLPYRSRHTVTGTAEWLGGLIGVDLQYRSRPDIVLVYPLDPRQAITLVDLRLAYRLFGLGLQLKISNLFQKQYTNVQERVPGPPRSVGLTIYRGL
ncbi:MAG TPA: TonB-dependent receptor, partial [Gemmatimonadales bacterium]|nr:TonB-dependent receptor [Gemmatimonadales bacterium]